ncbi:uncharacterized protein LOC119103637 [Pollicipes pollicipes]|uniref:uncharacterized protein LOC119103637 n=1 Tax=Pollicipes pollicipes TaxID=41117 RepID=UPI001884D1A6|nr:uncharacterized protein LOC119103637 [Pollicipes pollicipes]
MCVIPSTDVPAAALRHSPQRGGASKCRTDLPVARRPDRRAESTQRQAAASIRGGQLVYHANGCVIDKRPRNTVLELVGLHSRVRTRPCVVMLNLKQVVRVEGSAFGIFG